MKYTFIVQFLFFSFVFATDKDYSIKPVAKINSILIDEGSTLELSRRYGGILWTLNDSGDKARIFALNENGEVIKPSWLKEYKGLKINEAYNRDWECLVLDENGYMYIFDAGNNYNYRSDLAFYKLREPNPYLDDESGVIAKYPFHYSDQKQWPPSADEMNFDSEACYVDEGKLFLISKNRGKGPAKVYAFENLKPNEDNVAQVYDKFDFESMVTDASVSTDGRYLAVLTYDYIWIFEKKDGNFFKGKFHKKKINLGQAEGLAFSEGNIIVSNEKGFLFKIPQTEIMR